LTGPAGTAGLLGWPEQCYAGRFVAQPVCKDGLKLSAAGGHFDKVVERRRDGGGAAVQPGHQRPSVAMVTATVPNTDALM